MIGNALKSTRIATAKQGDMAWSDVWTWTALDNDSKLLVSPKEVGSKEELIRAIEGERLVHSFVAHYLTTKKASFEKFCEAALDAGQGVISDVERHVPNGTAANYISKIRALREFVIDRHLGSCAPDELAEILRGIGITGVNDISRRRLGPVRA